MADKKSEVYITVNHQQAETAVKQLKKSLASLTRQHEQLVAAGKEGTKRAKALWSQMNDLKAVIKENETNLKLVGNVMNNLSGSTLSQLNRALKNVKKEMSRVSGDNDRLEQLQAQYRAINEQIRIMKGEMVNIAKHIQNLSAVSDDWLSKAISQQKTLVATLRQGTPEYIKQLNALRTLNAEQVGRAQSAIASGNASAESLRASKATLTAYRDNIGTGALFDMGSAKDNTREIERVNEVLAQIDNQLNSIQGKNAEITKSVAEVAQQAEKIKLDPNSFSPKEIKAALSDINQKLQEMGVNDPMRTTLKKSAEELEKILDEVDKDLIDIDNLLKPQNLKTASLDKLKKAAAQLEKEIEKMDRNMGDFTDKQKQLQLIRGEIDRTTGAVNRHSSAWQTTIRNISTYFGVFQLFSMIQSKLTALIKLNLEFSDALANIRKVSGLAMSDINQLSVNLSKIDTRSSIEELNKLAYAGAKLGMGKYGAGGLEQFTRAANQVNVALKEDLGEEALTELSKLIEVMGLIPKLGVEQAMLKAGSAIFKLGATSTATGANIVQFSKRIMGLANVSGITTDQLLALGSASDAMGLMPEVSATAFNKMITAMQTNHNIIEKNLNMTKGTINEYFKQGKLMEAIVDVFDRMNKLGNMNALKPLMKDFNSDGARLNQVMTTMAAKVDMLKDHLSVANEAFREGSAVTEEYIIQQTTAAALVQRAANIWEKAFVNPTGVDYVRELAKDWYDFSKALTESSFYMGEIKVAFGMIWGLVRIGIAILPQLLEYLMLAGVARAVMGAYAAFTALRSALLGAATATTTLNAAMKANIFGAVATVLVSLGLAAWDYFHAAEKVTTTQEALNKAMAEAKVEADKQTSALDSYKRALDNVNLSEQQRQDLINKFNREYRSYIEKLGIEIKTVDDLKKAYDALNKEIRKKQFYELRERYKSERTDDIKINRMEAGQNYKTQLQKMGLQGFDVNWLEANQGRGTEAIYDEIMRTKFPTATKVKGTGVGRYSVRDNSSWTGMRDVGNEELRQSIDDWIKNYREEQKITKEADEMFKEEVGDYDPLFEKLLAGFSNEAPDKEANKAAADALRKQKKEWRDQLKQSQDEAKAIIDNIKNFYQRQITEVLRTANEQNWDITLTESAVRAVEGRMNLALSQARKGIAGIENTWDDFKKTMTDDMREQADEVGYNESQVLLDAIQKNNLEALRKKMSDLAKNLNMPETAVTDAIWKNATLNEKANETAEQKHRKAINSRLLEDNYTGKVDDEYTQSMETLGFFDIDESQLSTLMGGDESKIKNLLDKRANDIASLLSNAREKIVDIYNVDLSAEDGGKNQLLTILFGPDWMDSNTELKAVLKMDANEMKVFYDELLKYSDAYTEAQKKARDRQKRVIDFKWKNSAENNAITTAQDTNAVQTSKVGQHAQNAEKPAPRNDAYGTGAFISSMGADPEVEAYRLKMEAAAAYYEFLAKHGADAQTLRDQERAVLQSEMEYAQSVANQMKQRIDDIYALAEPVESFGTAMGKAFATMTEDAEAGRAAIRAAIGDMINGFMEQTVKMTEEFIKRRLMQEMNDRLTSEEMRATAEEQKGIEAQKQSAINQEQQEGQSAKTSIFKKLSRSFTKLFKKQEKTEITAEQKKQDEILDVQESGGEAQEILNVDVKKDIMGATQEIGAQTLAVQQQQTSTEVATESAKTQANTVMGIASGAAKIIGSLGWWGIPLVAVITALLNGLLAFAMGKVSSLFGGGSDSGSDSGPATKLVTGMLTYDSGNVQSFDSPDAPRKSSGSIDSPSSSKGDTRPVLGADGNVYNAREAGELRTGLVTEPITTLVNGQPAIVGEKGPEMVIGRETTEALQMARPDIIRDIIKFDKNFSGRGFRLFDNGNVGDLDLGDGNTPGGLQTEDIERLNKTISALGTVLTVIQQKGIPAHINKYGRGGVTNEAASGRDFMKTFSGDPLWKRD